jgi:hypothetical protein
MRATVDEKQKRLTVRPAKTCALGTPAEIAERTGLGPGITLEGGYLTLRWKKEQVAEAAASAGMSLEQILKKHVAPRLQATKTVHFKYRGKIITTVNVPDWKMRLKMMTVALKLMDALPDQ